jgi:hypothetical protein
LKSNTAHEIVPLSLIVFHVFQNQVLSNIVIFITVIIYHIKNILYQCQCHILNMMMNFHLIHLHVNIPPLTLYYTTQLIRFLLALGLPATL